MRVPEEGPFEMRGVEEGPFEMRVTLMVWTPPDGIDVPKWRCVMTPLEGGVRGRG
jgi:hypothetical protein